MNKSLTILIKGLVVLKSILAFLFLTSTIFVALELRRTRNLIEGRELIESTPEELTSLLFLLFAVVTTLLFDFRALKRKERRTYKNWGGLLVFSILAVGISSIFKIQWLGICLMSLLGLYAIYLLFKFPKNIVRK